MKAFLDAVNRRRIPRLGPVEYIQVEKLLELRTDWSRAELRAGLASLLALDREQWDYIVNLFDRHFPEEPHTAPERIPDPDPADETDQIQHDASAEKEAQRTPRWKHLHNVPRMAVLILVAVVFGCGIGVSILPLLKPPEPTVVPDPPQPDPPPQAEPSTQHWRREVLIPEQSKQIELTPPPRSFDTRDSIALGLSTLLVLLGLRWLLLPRTVERVRRQATQRHRQRSAAERKRLAEAAEQSGAPIHLSYQFETQPPLAEAAADDAASILGWLFQGVPSDDLDVPSTVQTSIKAGGRLIPVYADRNVARAFTVLVDVERGDHPWLAGLNWVLTRWATLGVHLTRFDFWFDPFYLTDQRTGKAVTLQDLSRRAEAEPLLVVSRTLSTQGYTDRAPWVDKIDVWPVKAWLDPDPRPLHERSPERTNIRRVERLGFQRFPFSQAGLLALARYLVEDGQGVRSPDWPPLAPLHDPVLAACLSQWALLAALVPDATWDQLDAIRRHFPELKEAFPDQRCVQRLIEWVSHEGGGSEAESEDGRTLVLSDALVERLICQQREQDEQKLEADRLEVQGRRLLLQQLDATKPKDALQQQFWQLKRVSHLLALEPERALELLEPMQGTAAEAELLDVIAKELDRETVLARFDTGVRDRLSLMLGRAAQQVRLGELFGGSWRTWLVPGLVVVAAVCLSAVVERMRAFDIQGWLLRPVTQTVAEAVVPAMYKIEQADSFPVFQDTLKDGSQGPLMVRLPAGTFVMSSPESEKGRFEWEGPLHEVHISQPFVIGKYEVTFADYDRFAEATKREKPDDRNWGRGNRPVISVSWEDAVAYAKWLSEQTGRQYRLPTEAEWEYAARAGTPTAYAFGDDADKLAEYGWYNKNSKGRTHPVGQLQPNAWGLHDMHGNVYEWVQDWWPESYAPEAVTDPQGPASGARRVIRGGSWSGEARYCRSSFRSLDGPGSRVRGIGFRVLRTAK